MASKSSKSKHPPMRIYLRLYPEFDLSMMAYLRETAKQLDRPLVWVLKQAVKAQMEQQSNA